MAYFERSRSPKKSFYRLNMMFYSLGTRYITYRLDNHPDYMSNQTGLYPNKLATSETSQQQINYVSLFLYLLMSPNTNSLYGPCHSTFRSNLASRLSLGYGSNSA